jgi:hypothetical protein
MSTNWLRRLLGKRDSLPLARRPRPSVRPYLEKLEDRLVPALVVTDSLTPQALVNNLLGTGVTASNITYAGTPLSSGTFTGGTGIIGFESGVVLSTGHAVAVVGPNTSGSTSFSNGVPGDPQLAALAGVPVGQTFDATVLEFDFIPKGTQLKFNFVFGSEEYNEFVTSNFNDAFGFFLNGTNVALLPGTNTPVSIHNVNLTTNPQFYINNALPTDPFPATPPLLNTELDGLTKVLSVTATVNPGVVNHIKLGITDVGDSAFDSDVFIQAGSFQAPPPALPAAAANLMAYRPLRYGFRSLEQNEGISGPLPVGGAAAVPTFDGNLTLLNFGPGASTNALMVEFANLPQDVQVVNATGVDPTTNLPFILVPAMTVPGGGTEALRVPVKISNPDNLPLGTFFEGPYFIDVLAVPAM